MQISWVHQLASNVFKNYEWKAIQLRKAKIILRDKDFIQENASFVIVVYFIVEIELILYVRLKTNQHLKWQLPNLSIPVSLQYSI